MNYQKESLRNALAAEYVLGTLRGGARRRYQQLIMTSQTIAETTWLWEQYLNGLGEDLPPVAPNKSVWESIQLKLGFIEKPKPSSWQRPTLFAIAASLFIVVLYTSLQPLTSVVAPVTQIAIVNDTEANPLWLIEVSEERLRVRATEQLVASATNDYELWIVPANGNAPISLGLLPKDGELNVPSPASLASVPINVLAVSLEPLGGSPTGQPTEVLYTSALLNV